MKNVFYYLLACLTMSSCNSSDKSKSTKDKNIIPKNEVNLSPELQKSMQRGSEVYNDLCVTCHLPDGKGVPKSFPPLANSDFLMNNRVKSIKAIKYGLAGEIIVNGKTYNIPMAAFGLTNTEVADVMNYITNSWGNKNSALITEKEVSKIKP